MAQDDSEDEVSVSAVDQGNEEAVASETSLAGDFTFGGALAEAAASSGSLITEAEEADQVGFSQYGGSNTILIVGAVALVALGIIVLVDGGGSSNEAPTAEDASASTDEDTPVDVAVTASDPDGDTLTYSAGDATSGSVTGGTGGSFTYTPNANFSGSDSFSVTVTDPDGETATSTVSVTVAAAADPVSGPASQDVSGDEEAAIAGSISLTDPDDGDTTTYAITAPASNGIVVLAEDGSFTYTGADDFFGSDAFTVTATSSDGSTADQVVNVAVANVNDAPVQGAGTTTSFNVQKNGSFDFDIDFSDPDVGDELDASSTAPANGTIDPTTNTYTPNADFVGSDTFDVTVSDGNGGDVTYSVAVEVIDQLITNIDVPASGAAVTFDAGSGDIVFSDNVGDRTDVILTNFAAGDSIDVSGIADQDDYFFTSSGGDVIVTFNDGTDFTQIVIDGGAVNAGFVFDYDTAVASLGFDFITIA
ncbi:MAG: tandem-95 repeat protein [Sphingomonadaceae bacterium]|nr:tandem-95 repeat protein [Sphingomonadaceae bacterium]